MYIRYLILIFDIYPQHHYNVKTVREQWAHQFFCFNLVFAFTLSGLSISVCWHSPLLEEDKLCPLLILHFWSDCVHDSVRCFQEITVILNRAAVVLLCSLRNPSLLWHLSTALYTTERVFAKQHSLTLSGVYSWDMLQTFSVLSLTLLF